MIEVKIKKLHEDAVFPTKAHKYDAGFDLTAVGKIYREAEKKEVRDTVNKAKKKKKAKGGYLTIKKK